MVISEKQINRLKALLGNGLIAADVCFYTQRIRALRCVFNEAPDPETIEKFEFTDELIHTLEFLQVPAYTIDRIRRTRNVFCLDEYPGLYGISLNIDCVFDYLD